MKRLTYAVQYLDETGAMRAPYQIMKGFAAAEWTTDFLTIEQPGNEHLERFWGTTPLQKVAGGSKKAKLLRLSLALWQRPRDRLVLTTVWDWHGFALAAARALRARPYAVRLDTYAYLREPTRRARLREWLRFGVVLRRAAIILAETPLAYEQARRHCKRAQVLHVPSCLWRADVAAVRGQLGETAVPTPTILFTGRLIPRKNVHDLVTAFAALAAKYPQWQLELRGFYDDVAYVAQIRELVTRFGLTDRVHFLPALSGLALYRRYGETAVYALPSTGEGMPTTILEAMAYGGAIIAGDSGGVAYQLNNGDCGIVHQPGDVAALQAGLDALMGSAARRQQIIKKARERLWHHFTWDVYFDEVAQRFRALLK